MAEADVHVHQGLHIPLNSGRAGAEKARVFPLFLGAGPKDAARLHATKSEFLHSKVVLTGRRSAVAWMGRDDVIPGARRLAVAMATSFGLLLAAGAAAILLANQAAEAERWVTHTLEVRRINP